MDHSAQAQVDIEEGFHDLAADKIFWWQLQLWHLKADRCTCRPWHTMDSWKANASAAKGINHSLKELPQQKLMPLQSAWPLCPRVPLDTCHCPAEISLHQCVQNQYTNTKSILNSWFKMHWVLQDNMRHLAQEVMIHRTSHSNKEHLVLSVVKTDLPQQRDCKGHFQQWAALVVRNITDW